MNELMIFNNPEFGDIRTIEEDGRVLFCGADVAKALGYAKPQNAVATHCRGALKRGILTNGGEQEMSFIPESDLYRLVFGSKLPTAEKFTDWVTSEVLPSIRKHGGYLSGQETMSPEELMAKALKVAEKTLADREARISALTVENHIMAPKAEYFDELVDRNLLTNFRETAKQLNVPPKKFVSFLLEKKYIYRDKRGKLLPYEDRNNGLFEVKECFNEKTQWSGTQTLVTPKGRETFRLLCPGA
ncbi:phage antirepressor KilAC domain-containing protein [Intestinimonas sp.]|uniref:phage antirepressor KilAC domain-containing protein n=1 Tax=Intestinimonas sp. TaxID=1965293 RepID=UPI00260D6358|nr:phage antirepressor KilAC domain-containing protein [Intestinimonas sp.]